MGFNCGIVGLPNVGKSTLFNALTATAQAEAENYPFCTIEPNLGRVVVPDGRLDVLAKLAKSARIVPTQLEFTDIAGLVRGASKGEGLGNKFLAHIREVDAILHVLRCFEDSDVAHVEGHIDPAADAEVVETELMLADLESLEKRLDPLVKKGRGSDKEAAAAAATAALIERILPALHDGKPARSVAVEGDDVRLFRNLQLLSAKPVLYVCNVEESAAADGNDFSARIAAKAEAEGAGAIVISAAIEAEVAQLTDEADRAEFLGELGLEEPGLDRLIREGYRLLGLITFFTVAANEARAWTVAAGTAAPAAAGRIHTDMQRGFIAAETITYDDYVAHDGELGAKAAGKMRAEGKGYVIQDGDVILFRFNV